MIRFPLLFFIAVILFGCPPTDAPVKRTATAPLNTEARQDSLALVAAYAAQTLIEPSVTASVETAGTRAAALEDAADDPAVWRHPTDPARSLVFGSNKTGGIAAYDLAGTEVAYYPIGRINNIDILTGVPLGDSTVTLLGGSNRTDRSVDLFRVDPQTGGLTDVAVDALVMDSTLIDDVYGFCLGRSGTTSYAIINGKNGRMLQFALVETNGKLGLKPVRDVAFASQTEGMVADSELGWLYVGEEGRGVWKLPLDPANDAARPGQPETQVGAQQGQRKVKAAQVATNPALVADVEGLTLAREPGGKGYLVVSVQGNFSYAVFDRTGDNAYRGSFKITDGPASDGAEETDGLEVRTGNFGPAFPNGLLVAQDGFNFNGDSLLPQNFKLVDWGAVVAELELE